MKKYIITSDIKHNMILVLSEDNKHIKTIQQQEKIYKNKIVIGYKTNDFDAIGKELETQGYVREYSEIEKSLMTMTTDEKIEACKSFKPKSW